MVHLNHIKLPSYYIVLILGSYDKRTHAILQMTRNNLSESLMHIKKNTLILLLNSVEMFYFETLDKRKIVLITEILEDRLTFYLVNETEIIDIDQQVIKQGNDVKEIVYNYIEMRYPNANIFEYPIFDKLDVIASMATIIFFIRHKELTRGGEYIELAHLLNTTDPSKMYFLKKEGFDLSTMTLEILEKKGVHSRTYRKESHLVDHTKRIFYNITKENDSHV